MGYIEGSRSTARNKFLSQSFTPRNNVDKTVERAGQRILSSKYPTPRTSCPLNPEYSMHAETTHPFLRGESDARYAPKQMGTIEKAVPKVLHKDNGEPQNSLIRSDVRGAIPQ